MTADPLRPPEDRPATSEHFIVAPEDAGQRIDRVIALHVAALSRSRIKMLIDAGSVSADGQTISSASSKVKPGVRIKVSVPAPVDDRPRPQAIPLSILFEDAHLIVVDKPAGMVVHPAPGNSGHTLVNALLAHCGESLAGIGGVRRPGIVHRLDKDTSGLMVIAKTEQAHKRLSADFAARRIQRAYHAVVWGTPSPRSGTIEGAIGRSLVNRKKMAVVESGGRSAITDYVVVRPLGLAASLVECRLRTGRTHQIRVHMTAIGHPLIGDPVYGRTTRARTLSLAPPAAQFVAAFRRQALHAWLLGFEHPVSGKSLSFSASYPADFEQLTNILEPL